MTINSLAFLLTARYSLLPHRFWGSSSALFALNVFHVTLFSQLDGSIYSWYRDAIAFAISLKLVSWKRRVFLSEDESRLALAKNETVKIRYEKREFIVELTIWVPSWRKPHDFRQGWESMESCAFNRANLRRETARRGGSALPTIRGTWNRAASFLKSRAIPRDDRYARLRLPQRGNNYYARENLLCSWQTVTYISVKLLCSYCITSWLYA